MGPGFRRFQGIDDVSVRLDAAGYLADEAIATVVHLADRLDKRLMVEGSAGVGRTEGSGDGSRGPLGAPAVLRGRGRGQGPVRVERSCATTAMRSDPRPRS